MSEQNDAKRYMDNQKPDAPERLELAVTGNRGWCAADDSQIEGGLSVEYIRADLIEAERQAAKQELARKIMALLKLAPRRQPDVTPRMTAAIMVPSKHSYPAGSINLKRFLLGLGVLLEAEGIKLEGEE